LLNFDHPDGASKAAVYDAMGFNLSNVDDLEIELLRLVYENEINTMNENQYGTKYVVIGMFYGKQERTRAFNLQHTSPPRLYQSTEYLITFL
jgi:hypothetical protein